MKTCLMVLTESIEAPVVLMEAPSHPDGQVKLRIQTGRLVAQVYNAVCPASALVGVVTL